VHMGVIATPLNAGGRATQKEINVIGTMQLLAACQKDASRASGSSSSRRPGLRLEPIATRRCSPRTWPPSGCPRVGFGKDSVEVEGYVRGFARRRPDVGITMLRFANVIGPRIRTAMTDYFRLPLIPMPLGWDARLQFIHEDDVAGRPSRATLAPRPARSMSPATGSSPSGQAVGPDRAPLPGDSPGPAAAPIASSNAPA
jgi:UDP-glucose 4-epimerase